MTDPRTHDGEEMFAAVSWVQVMLGQHTASRSYHPLAAQMPEQELGEFMTNVAGAVANGVEAMPPHQAVIDRYCAASAPVS